MSFKRKKDLAVKTGTYTGKDGVTKNRYANVGTLMEDDDTGAKFLLIDPCFNFAGVSREQGKDRVMVSLFDIKPKEEAPKLVTSPDEIVWQE